MKIFVSSRMVELSNERKVAVDSLHFAGHTPLYIETEPEVKDLAAKQVMDSLVHSAEAFVLIYYLSEGRLESILGGWTPIQYEFDEDTTTPVKEQFYIELRTIDAPGQLNAVCKVL